MQLLGVASRLRSTANAFVPINRLPPEVLCEVFFYLRPMIRKESKQPQSKRPPFEDLLAITHVCRHWRGTAIAAPELWSQLNVGGPSKNLNDLTRLFIRRSGELPLDVELGCRPVAVVPYIHRLRTLSCAGPIIWDFSGVFRQRSAPLLETLHIPPHPGFGTGGPLPMLFNGDFPSLRELDINGFNPFPNNNFRSLSSFRLQFLSDSGNPVFWVQLFTMLRNSPQLEEFFLHLGSGHGNPPPIKDIHPPIVLHALQRLHIRGLPPTLVGRFLKFIDLPPSGVAMQFTNISHFDWISPPTLPLDLSFYAATSLEIIYRPITGFVIQGANQRAQIRVVETSDSNATHEEVFSHLIPRTDLQHHLRELWIHIGRGTDLKSFPLSKFPCLEKLVVRAAPGRDPVRRLQQLEVTDNRVPCPLLSTLDLSGGVNIELLVMVLRPRSVKGHRLQRLRLGKGRGTTKDIGKLRVRDYVDELEIFDVSLEPRGMDLPVVCTTDLGEWWQSWTPEQTTPVVDGGSRINGCRRQLAITGRNPLRY